MFLLSEKDGVQRLMSGAGDELVKLLKLVSDGVKQKIVKFF